MNDDTIGHRFIIETGMGTDQRGGDYTKAAMRAVESALRRSSLSVLNAIGVDHTEMRVVATLGAQAPEDIDLDAIKAILPRGRVAVQARQGGLDVADPAGGDPIVVVVATIEAHLPDQTGAWRLCE